MAYHEKDKERIFEIYVLDGTAVGTAEKARQSSPRLEKLDRKTVQVMIDELDWKARREGILKQKRIDADRARAEGHEQAIRNIGDILSSTFEAAMGAEPSAKAALVAQYLKLQELYNKLMGIGEGNAIGLNAAQMRMVSSKFMTAMMKIDEIAEAMDDEVRAKLAVAVEKEFTS